MICRECLKKLPFVKEHYCMKCGKPAAAEQEYCSQCSGKKRSFTQGRSVLMYNDVLKVSVLKYKYEERREYGDFYAKLMCYYGKKDILRWNPDIILPVPLHRRKQRLRGFNQAAYLAIQVGEYFGIPVSENVLKNVKNTKSQKKLDAANRAHNLKNAFAVCEDVTGLDILVIDDVYTTGSTMEEIASLLRAKGAQNVYFFTICTGYN